MPSYKNEKCPVCNQEFKDGDDIVTCPVCGTPHHRECYKKIGHCFNEDKHAEGYEFKKTNETKIEEKAHNVNQGTAVHIFRPTKALKAKKRAIKASLKIQKATPKSV